MPMDTKLFEHGTTIMRYTPSMLAHQAEIDFERCAWNRAHVEESPEDLKRYGFLGYHIRNAKDPAGVLRKALRAIEKGGKMPKKPARFLLYSDPDALNKAIAILETDDASPRRETR